MSYLDNDSIQIEFLAKHFLSKNFLIVFINGP